MEINPIAPVVQKKEILINATPTIVWKILTDINHWNQWNSKIKNPKMDGELAVGSTFSWTINGSKINSTIQNYFPDKQFGWTGKTFGATAIHNWYLEPTDNGTTVRVEESMEGWVVNLMKKRMNTIVAEDMTYWLERLKQESERSNPQA